jgi:hypothetical protein
VSTVVRWLAGSPTRLLVLVWLGAVAVFVLGPIRYEDPPRTLTWMFIAACVAAFALGAQLATLRRRNAERPHSDSSRHLETIVRTAALVGLFGAACIAIDKTILSGLDFSQGVAALRFERQQAAEAGATGVHRSVLLYVGYLTFSFSVASFLLYLLNGERLGRSTMWLAFMSLASIFSYSYLYGGRTPLALVVGMAFGAIFVRRLSRKSFLPQQRTGRFLFVGLLLLTVFYSEAVLSDRLTASGANDYSVVESRLEAGENAKIVPVGGVDIRVAPGSTSAPSVSATAAPRSSFESPSGSEMFLMRLAVNFHYVTHEVPALDRAFAYEPGVGPYFGAYEFYLVPSLVSKFVPSWNIDAIMIPELQAAQVYGYWPTAWGGMYFDFGVVGALIGALVCGWVAGRIYFRAIGHRDEGAQLLMCYVVAGIIATPFLPIFVISISLLILLSLLITTGVLRAARLRTVALPAAPVPSGGATQAS